MPHPYVIMTFTWPTCAIPSSAHLKKQAKLQHFDVRLTLSAQSLTSFLIHRLILITIASRRFTIDPAKKKKFLNFILQSPKLRVPDAMKLAMFSDEDIAELGLRRFLQRALPGGTVNAMKAHLAGLLPPQPLPPDCNNRCKKRSSSCSHVTHGTRSARFGQATRVPTTGRYASSYLKRGRMRRGRDI